MVVSPVVVVVAAASLYTPSPSVAGQRASGVWSLKLLMLMVATFVSPPQCSRLQPNLHLKDSANENSSFLVRSILPRALIQRSDIHGLGLYLGFYGTAWIGWRHHERLFRLFFTLFEFCILVPLCTSTAKKRTHSSLKSPNILPMRFECMLVLNIPI